MTELAPTIAWDGLVVSDSLWRRRPTEPRVEFLSWALDATESVRGGCHRPTATGRVERIADSDEPGQFRLAFVAPGPIDGGGKGFQPSSQDVAIPADAVVKLDVTLSGLSR